MVADMSARVEKVVVGRNVFNCVKDFVSALSIVSF